MTVAELIEILRAMPQDLTVCVPDYVGNQTTDDVEILIESVYGTTCVIIAPPEES